MSCVGIWEPFDGSDDYPIGMDFSSVDLFVANEITSATAVVVEASKGKTSDLTLGAVTVTDNVAVFRVSGGVEGTNYDITVTATNAASPPNVVSRTGILPVDSL